MRAREYIENLASNGRSHFSSAEAFAAIGASPAAVRARLRRLKQQGLLAENLDATKLLEVAWLSPVSWAQRLGYILERVDQGGIAKALAPFVQQQARSYTPLRRAAAIARAKRSPRWKLVINPDLEPDA